MIGSASTGTLWPTTGEGKNDDVENGDNVENSDEVENDDDKNSNDGRARSQWQVTRQSSRNGPITN
jgi:hypothetical protein